jgi:hypothetical protein
LKVAAKASAAQHLAYAELRHAPREINCDI